MIENYEQERNDKLFLATTEQKKEIEATYDLLIYECFEMFSR
jgi:hypothetical protein